MTDKLVFEQDEYLNRNFEFTNRAGRYIIKSWDEGHDLYIDGYYVRSYRTMNLAEQAANKHNKGEGIESATEALEKLS